MARYSAKTDRRFRHLPRRVLLLAASLLLLAIVSAAGVRQFYTAYLRPVSANQQTQLFTVKKGSTVKQIAGDLQATHLIRSAWALELYVHSKELSDKLQAGTYAFAPSESTPAIVSTLTKGKVSTRLITILPGRRIDQIRADLINDGFIPSDVDAALDASKYNEQPALTYKPASVHSLEGLLWPDSFQKDSNTNPALIIRESLAETATHMTADTQAALAGQGLSPYQGLVLASIVEQEVSKPGDRTQAAQVFLSRLKTGMMLGSDVTANYGSIAAGRSPSLTYDSAYNTLLHTGLPPSPISTVSASSLQAVAHPATTSWLYFVAGDDGTTYFSTNLADHQALAQKYCHKLCSATN
ncbi:MAG: endolytic transglycosylase MltG [Candidatus Saccharibacteria bacterium]